MKKLVLTVVLALGLCAFAALPASAESGTREAEIAYRCIKIVIDGQEICPRDAAGNEVEPFILDGTTYLPVRAVADALGLEVFWRSSDSTVLLYKTKGSIPDMLSIAPPEPPVGTGSAHGHQAAETVRLNYRDVRLLIDGVVTEPADTGGNAVEPFILNGTTYLPVRAVADALGLAVDWDAASATVRLSRWLPSEYAMKMLSDDGTEETVHEQKYEYDRYGRLVYNREEYSLQRTESRLSYDDAGRLVSRESISYYEDTLGWPSSAKRLTGYVYDEASGLCISAESTVELVGENYLSTIAYEYDENGRLVRVTDTPAGFYSGAESGIRKRTVTLSYDAQGRIAQERVTVQPETVKSLITTDFSYTLSYDDDGRIIAVELDTGDEYAAQYDFNGTLVYLAGSYSYGYDKSGRLVTETGFAAYDGERVETSVSGSVYNEDGQLVCSERTRDNCFIDETLCFYDENGNLVRRETHGDSFAGGKAFVETWKYVKAGG